MSDLISREAAIDALTECANAYKEQWDAFNSPEAFGGFCGVGSAMHDIEALPSVQPEDTIEMQESDIDEAMKLVRDARVTILPSAQPEQRWIPCSERLPDTDDHVLCTTITRKGVRNIVRGYYFHDDSYPGGGQWSAGMNSNVIAWMSLPEPYQGGQ